MLVLGIDPNPKQIGAVLWDAKNEKILFKKVLTPDEALRGINDVGMLYMPYNILYDQETEKQYMDYNTFLAIERIRGYGMVAGNSVFDTCEIIGALEEAGKNHFKKVFKVPRKTVITNLCNNPRAGDKDARAYLIDRIGDKGTKKAPGPTFGFNDHLWPALAVAVCVGDAWVLTERVREKRKICK